MARILIGGLSHETNTFNPAVTDLAAFRAGTWLEGEALLAARRDSNSEVGGFLDVLEHEAGIELLPSLVASATPAGLVSAEVLTTALAHWLNAWRDAGTVDGILLALHGALVAENADDGEGWLLARLREAVGADLPIVCTLDLHANLTPEMATHADALTVYRTYPHMDLRERGREAATILLHTLRGEIRPVTAVAKRPLLIGPPQNVLPVDEPMRDIMARAREMERTIPGVIAACPAHGFMQQDVYHAGVGACVTADGDPDMAQRLAEELAELLWSHRHEYQVELPDPAETIRRALRLAPPVAIADSGDNIGGGTPGDGTALLHEILRQGVDRAFVTLWDPRAARKAAEAGIGAEVTLEVGGKSDPLYGPPARIQGVVRALSDGRYLNRAEGGYSAGIWSDMGLTARVDAGGLTLALTSRPASPNNIMHARSLGIWPEDYRLIVCKGGLAFREAYKPPVIASYIEADTPGYSSSVLQRFTYERVRRPIYPLDEI